MPPKGGRKAQSMILEQVLLFAIGVSVFVACLGIFGMYQHHFLSISTDDQLNQVTDFITSHILRLCNNGNETNSSAILEIPQKTGNGYYEISLSNSGLRVTDSDTGASKFSPLYNLSVSMQFSGKTVSRGGKLMIYKKADRIIIS